MCVVLWRKWVRWTRDGGRGTRDGGCSFLFKEKERTKGKPFWRKTAFFGKGFFVKPKCETGYRPSPSRHPHGVRGKGLAEGRGFVLRPSSLGWRESERGGTSQAFPWKGKGDRRRRGMRLTSRQGEGDGAEGRADEVDKNQEAGKSFRIRGDPFRRRRRQLSLRERAKKLPMHPSGGAKPRPRTGWGSPAGSPRFVFCLQKTKPSPPQLWMLRALRGKKKIQRFRLEKF